MSNAFFLSVEHPAIKGWGQINRVQMAEAHALVQRQNGCLKKKKEKEAPPYKAETAKLP